MLSSKNDWIIPALHSLLKIYGTITVLDQETDQLGVKGDWVEQTAETADRVEQKNRAVRMLNNEDYMQKNEDS